MKAFSIRTKFILAFLAASLVGIALVAVFISVFTNQQYENIFLDNLVQDLSQRVMDYYETHQTLAGIQRLFRPPAGAEPDPAGTFDRPGVLLTLPNRTIIVGDDYHPVGQQLSLQEFSDAHPIEVEGQTIAYLVTFTPQFRLSPQEAQFIETTNQALVYASLIAVAIAILLGFGFTRTLLKPLTHLNHALKKVSQGDLSQEVPKTTEDEFGDVIDAFNQMSKALDTANQQRKQMTADIAHELRSPLTVISGYLEAIEEGSLEATPERLNAIKEEVALLNRLVIDLRTLALADAGQISIQKEGLKLSLMLQHLRNAYELKASEKQISLVVDQTGSKDTIYADEGRLLQILSNLINNAIRHTPPGGKVEILAQTHLDIVQFKITDTGEGIAEEDLDLVFQRFYRADSSRETRSGEIGLGLSIVKALVDAHHGEIGVTSEVDKGTTFTITLPQ